MMMNIVDKFSSYGSLKKGRKQTDKNLHRAMNYEANKYKVRKVKTFNIDTANADKLVLYSERTNLSQSSIINIALNEYFENHNV